MSEQEASISAHEASPRQLPSYHQEIDLLRRPDARAQKESIFWLAFWRRGVWAVFDHQLLSEQLAALKARKLELKRVKGFRFRI